MIIRTLVAALSVGAAAMGFAGTADAAQVKSIHSFCARAACADGAKPWAAPVTDGQGNWYGTTFNGGPDDSGTVFQMSFDGAHWATKTIHAFCVGACRDGSGPRGGLVVGMDGSLYGMTGTGGMNGAGTIYRLTPDGAGGWSFDVLHAFCRKAGCADGARPTFASLTYQGAASGALYDGTAPLYGTTTGGGAHGQGVVFTLTPDAMDWKLKVIHNFCSSAACADGALPDAPVTVDAMGHVFGTTTLGGSNNHGVVFALTRGASSWAHKVLHSFCESGGFCADGDDAMAPLVIDAHGDLIGTTYFGGAHAKGSVFKLTPNGTHSAFTTLYSFCAQAGCADGSHPQAPVTLAGGRLVGTTYDGGSANEGTVFKLAGAEYASFTSLHSFGTAAKAGSFPTSGLTLDGDGNLFGTTVTGGAHDLGLVYEIKP